MLWVRQRDTTTNHLIFIKYFLSIYYAQTVGDLKKKKNNKVYNRLPNLKGLCSWDDKVKNSMRGITGRRWLKWHDALIIRPVTHADNVNLEFRGGRNFHLMQMGIFIELKFELCFVGWVSEVVLESSKNSFFLLMKTVYVTCNTRNCNICSKAVSGEPSREREIFDSWEKVHNGGRS